MHPTAFFHILTALGSILVSASSTNLDPSDGTADSPRVRRAMRSEYKRFSTPTSSSGSGTPVEAAALPIHALVQCHGNLPPPQTMGNAQGGPFVSLLDWCIRGPARCQCVYQALNQVYDIRCAMDDFLLDMVPGIVACHNHCDCGPLTDRTTLERLAGAALGLARVRTELA